MTKNTTNGNAATYALADALSGVIKEAFTEVVAPLEAKVDSFAQGQNLLLEVMSDIQVHLDERIDTNNLKVQAQIANLIEAFGLKPAGIDS